MYKLPPVSVIKYELSKSRNAENGLVFPPPGTDYLRDVFHTAELWNNLPIDLRQACSLTDFRQFMAPQ